MGYYLADGIYPLWATFVKTIHRPKGNKKSHFAICQEFARKDVERAFGVLQIRFVIASGPAEYGQPQTLWQIMTACVILHSIIIEDEREDLEDLRYLYNGVQVEPEHNPNKIESSSKHTEGLRTEKLTTNFKKILLSTIGDFIALDFCAFIMLIWILSSFGSYVVFEFECLTLRTYNLICI